MAERLITLNTIQAALDLRHFDAAAAQEPMMPGSRSRNLPSNGKNSRQAGVLLLLYPLADELHFVLTRRTETLRGHSGQVSFPGGRRDPEDDTLIDTALRETHEELGIWNPDMHILGNLTPIYIPPSNFEVFPTVAALDEVPEFQPNPAEVAQVFSVPVGALLDDDFKRVEHWPFNGNQVRIPFYAFNDHKVWGATAIMLSEFEGRLRAVLPQDMPQK
ncbi:MAG: coenzyme A pyrophosphatase [Anaerolineaceae bacterium]|nr:coenzyme A pyrophosphatase [Anaerolineaceae bacterium]